MTGLLHILLPNKIKLTISLYLSLFTASVLMSVFDAFMCEQSVTSIHKSVGVCEVMILYK